MTFLKKGLPLLIGILLAGNVVFAQKNEQNTTKDVTNKELKEFSHVAKEVQKMNINLKRQAQEEINKSDLSQARYREIAISKMNPQTDTLSLAAKEQKEYQELHAKLASLQAKMQSKLKTNVKKEGLAWERFQQIAMELRRDKELQQRFRKIMMQQEMKPDSTGNS